MLDMEMKIIFICATVPAMNIAIVISCCDRHLLPSAGGALAIRSRDRLHLVLGLSAGLLLGLVAFDLNP